MDVGKIVRLVAVVFALVAGLVTIPQSALIIAVLGLVGGWFIEEDYALRFLVSALVLNMAHGALGAIPGVGDYLTSMLGSLSALFNAGAIMIIVMATVRRLMP